MTLTEDSAAVRTGEELDLAALDFYLRQQLPALDDKSKIQILQFPGGHSNLTYLVRYGNREFVLRRPPLGPVAPTAHDMPREFKVLSVISPHFGLAPKPILLCDDSSVIGVSFYLMERRQGLILRSREQISDDEVPMRRRLSESVVDALIALHAVDIQATGITQIGKPLGFVERQVRGWAERWQRSKTGDLPEMDRTIEWLVKRIPTDDKTVATIVHNDFKLDNIMLAEDDRSRVVAVLDWEMCSVGDPLIDVGLFLSYWTMSGGRSNDPNSSLRAITHGPGWLTRDEIIERYEAATGRDLSRIAFYETFARFKVAVVIQQIYYRYAKRQTSDERFRNFDQLVRELTLEALELAESSGVATN